MQPDAATHINDELESLKARVEAIYISVEKTRKYFLWTMILTVALFVLPLIGLVFVIPSFLSNYVGGLQGATGATSTIDYQGISQSLGI